MKKTLSLLIIVSCAGFPTGARAAQDVREDLVSYWPLDAILPDGITTRDVVSSNNMTLNLMDSTSLVPGQRGQAMIFDGLSQYLSFTTPEGVDTGLPISLAPSFSVLFWVKGITTNAATGEVQADRRVFSEASSTNDNPLFNIGTHTGGTDNTGHQQRRSRRLLYQQGQLPGHRSGASFVVCAGSANPDYRAAVRAGFVHLPDYVDFPDRFHLHGPTQDGPLSSKLDGGRYRCRGARRHHDLYGQCRRSSGGLLPGCAGAVTETKPRAEAHHADSAPKRFTVAG